MHPPEAVSAFKGSSYGRDFSIRPRDLLRGLAFPYPMFPGWVFVGIASPDRLIQYCPKQVEFFNGGVTFCMGWILSSICRVMGSTANLRKPAHPHGSASMDA